MVPSEQCHLVRPPCLQHHQPGQSLQAVVPSVHKVPHEEVVCVWDISSYFEQLLEIIELTMNVATHCHGRVYPLNVAFLN